MPIAIVTASPTRQYAHEQVSGVRLSSLQTSRAPTVSRCPRSTARDYSAAQQFRDRPGDLGPHSGQRRRLPWRADPAVRRRRAGAEQRGGASSPRRAGVRQLGSLAAGERPHVMTGDGARSGKGTDAAGDVEPDYRFTLANERTFPGLAAHRTGPAGGSGSGDPVRAVPLGAGRAARAGPDAGCIGHRGRASSASAGGRRPSAPCGGASRCPRQPSPVYIGIGLVLVTLLALGLVLTKAMTG